MRKSANKTMHRNSLLILLVVEFCLAVALTQVGTMHRSQFNRAFMKWYQHPTVETRQAFDRQKRITEYDRWGFSGVVFAVLAGATVFVYWLRRRGEPNASPNGGPAASADNSRVAEGPPSVS
jgi:hypothetical protein